MSSNWVYPLDVCAAAGILDYDAPADILGQEPRYMGSPKFSDIPTIDTSLLPDGTKLKGQPKSDQFKNSSKDLINNPTWKKWAFGGLATLGVGGAVVAALVSKGKIKLPKMPSMPKLSKAGTYLKNLGAKIWNFIKRPFVYIASKFHKP